MGTQAGSTSKIQQNRISIGANAGQNGTGNENTAIGLNAGDNVTGNFNVAMGSSAGGSTTVMLIRPLDLKRIRVAAAVTALLSALLRRLLPGLRHWGIRQQRRKIIL